MFALQKTNVSTEPGEVQVDFTQFGTYARFLGAPQPVGVGRAFWLTGALLVLVIGLATVPPAHGAYETLKIQGGTKEFVPGDSIRLVGHSWFGPISNCKNRVAIRLKDKRGKQHSLGSIGPLHTNTFGIGSQTVKNFWDIGGTVKVPGGGVTPGTASLIAIQRIKFRIPFTSICAQVARKQSRLSGLRIAGPEGDAPPEVTDLIVPDMRQGRSSPMSWRSSEAGHTTVMLSFLFTSGHPLEVSPLLLDEPRPAGTNTLDRDATVGGKPLPAGRYRIELRIRDSAGSFSAPVRREFTIGFG